jgi:hypothetical protein
MWVRVGTKSIQVLADRILISRALTSAHGRAAIVGGTLRCRNGQFDMSSVKIADVIRIGGLTVLAVIVADATIS